MAAAALHLQGYCSRQIWRLGGTSPDTAPYTEALSPMLRGGEPGAPPESADELLGRDRQGASGRVPGCGPAATRSSKATAAHLGPHAQRTLAAATILVSVASLAGAAAAAALTGKAAATAAC